MRRIPDHHLHGVDAHAQAVRLGDGIGHAPAAVGHQRVQVQPLTRGRLRHDVHVHLEPGRLVTSGLCPWPPIPTPGHREAGRAPAVSPCPYLLPCQGDHVQGPVHEPARQNLRAILVGNGVIDPVVGCHVLGRGGARLGQGGGWRGGWGLLGSAQASRGPVGGAGLKARKPRFKSSSATEPRGRGEMREPAALPCL